ncbi:protein LplC [Clostridia bacterium]|nr:protein LplC [Clostridia bacterium]
MKRKSIPEKVFMVFNFILLGLAALLCVAPVIHLLALSLSSNAAATSGQVGLWPKDFTLASYEFVLKKPEFLGALWVSVKRVFVGVPINLILTILCAYPLSMDNRNFRMRTVYVWFIFVTMLFSGGLIPTYMTVRQTGLMDTIWSLIIPGALPAFYVLIMLNFFRGLPKELQESAFIDGAGHWRCLWNIYVPLATAPIATITLFAFVAHWNSWFDGMIYLNNPGDQPLQTYLRHIIQTNAMSQMSLQQAIAMADRINDRTLKAAQIFLAMVPVLIVYPLAQRYFTEGVVLGSVKE